MNKKTGIIMTICCAISACLSIAAFIIVLVKTTPKVEVKEESDVQYVLYLGTNDKDTNTPVFAPEEAKGELIEILLKHFGGYTIQEANGGWDDNGTLYKEYTLVIYLSDTTIDKVHAACDEMIQVFNQSSILIQTNQTKTEYYSK